MTYSETIKASKTWTCPKSGIYKIICIGGGGSGSASLGNTAETATSGTAGGTTSFGTYLSAAGGATGADNYAKGYITAAGIATMGTGTVFNSGHSINGYNGASVYGTPNTASVTGCGYGASGAAAAKGGSLFVTGGQPGEVVSGIFDIDVGKQVACTVGKGGAGVTASNTSYNVCCYPGADGAIMIQYLGESM